MKVFKNFAAKLMLAAAMAWTGAAAVAGPVYHVVIDTASIGGGSAYLGLSFLGLDGADSDATVSGVVGALSGVGSGSGDVSGSLETLLSFGSAGGGGDFVQPIILGGAFSFDVRFDVGTGDIGSAFSYSLFNDTQYLGVNGDLGTFFLDPSAAQALQVTPPAANPFSSVSAVPEPASVLLVLLGVCMLLLTSQRMRRR
jgi:hypothetical protein